MNEAKMTGCTPDALAGLRALVEATRVPPEASGNDARLLDLLAETHAAEAAFAIACDAPDDRVDQVTNLAAARIDAALANMIATPADTLLGVALKAARICFTLDGNNGHPISDADEAVARSLAADIERLVPGIGPIL